MKRKVLGVIMLGVVLLFGLQLGMEHLFRIRLSEMTEETMAETVVAEERETELPKIFAVFGVDQEEGDQGRSDCVLLASLGEDRMLRLCSIARDTLVTLPTGEETKLCHAYALGGPELALETIRENFDLPVEEYVSVNFSQLSDIVDLLGGVELQLSEAEWRYLGLGKTYLGKSRLDGETALCYSRIRSIDNDTARGGRHRKLVLSMVDAMGTLPRSKFPELVVEGMKLCRTNVDLLTVMGLGKDLLTGEGEITSCALALPGDAVEAWGGTRDDGVWYYVYDLGEASRVAREFFYGAEASSV